MEKSTRNYDFTQIIKPEHSGKWVALNKNQTKIVGYSGVLRELTAKVGKQDVVYMKVPRAGVSYAYLSI